MSVDESCQRAIYRSLELALVILNPDKEKVNEVFESISEVSLVMDIDEDNEDMVCNFTLNLLDETRYAFTIDKDLNFIYEDGSFIVSDDVKLDTEVKIIELFDAIMGIDYPCRGIKLLKNGDNLSLGLLYEDFEDGVPKWASAQFMLERLKEF